MTIAGRVTDGGLRWLYANCWALVAASHEDFGLTPLEAAGFGKPTAALRWGGFLDTVDEGVSGVFFDTPVPSAIAATLRVIGSADWDPVAIQKSANRFSPDVFERRLRALVDQEA